MSTLEQTHDDRQDQDHQERRCERCPALLVPRKDEHPAKFGRRRYCSPSCAAEGRAAERRGKRNRSTVHRVETVRELLEAGESPQMIPARLGVSLATLARWLYRVGEPELASPFAMVEKRLRGHKHTPEANRRAKQAALRRRGEAAAARQDAEAAERRRRYEARHGQVAA